MQSSGEKMNKFGTVVLLQPESVKTQMKLKANLIVPDFKNFCVQQFIQFIFFAIIFTPLLSLPIYWHPQGRIKCQDIVRARKEERMN